MSLEKVGVREVLTAVDSVAGLLDEVFPVDGAGDDKREVLKELLYDLLPDSYVDRNWPRLERLLARVVKLRKRVSQVIGVVETVRAVRSAARGK